MFGSTGLAEDPVSWEILADSTDRKWPELHCVLLRGRLTTPVKWTESTTNISFLLSGKAKVQSDYVGTTEYQDWSSSSICLFRPLNRYMVSSETEILVVNCAITHSSLCQFGNILCNCEHPEYQIRSRMGFHDPDLWGIGEALRYELTSRKAPDRARQELLNQTVVDYLLRQSETCQNCATCSQFQRSAFGLSSARMFPLFWKIVGFITANLVDEGLSLERIAAEVDLSPSHFARMFRSEMGVTPHRYIVEHRVQLAANLLENTTRPISNVAYACGFSSHSHLTATFRRVTGETPMAYRRQFASRQYDIDSQNKDAS